MRHRCLGGCCRSTAVRVYVAFAFQRSEKRRSTGAQDNRDNLGEGVSARGRGLSVEHSISVDHRDVGSTWCREEQGNPATAEEEAGC